MSIGTETLHPDERAQYEAQMRRRVKQLARLLSLPIWPPTTVLSLFMGNLLRCSIPLCGPPLAAELLEWLGRQLREHQGRCPFCGAQRATGALMCDGCAKEMETLDRELLLHSADEERPAS